MGLPLRKTIDTLTARLAQGFAATANTADTTLGDDMLHSTYPRPLHYRPAAVLVPLTLVDDTVHVVLIERAAGLQHHPGQISFPGGRAEENDADAIVTALREAEEEVALPRHLVQVLGTLPAYPTRSGFVITPVIGAVPHLPVLQPDSNEVARVFTHPLDYFTDTQNRRIDVLRGDDFVHEFYAFDTPHGLVWGATAGILVNLARLLNKA